MVVAHKTQTDIEDGGCSQQKKKKKTESEREVEGMKGGSCQVATWSKSLPGTKYCARHSACPFSPRASLSTHWGPSVNSNISNNRHVGSVHRCRDLSLPPIYFRSHRPTDDCPRGKGALPVDGKTLPSPSADGVLLAGGLTLAAVHQAIEKQSIALCSHYCLHSRVG